MDAKIRLYVDHPLGPGQTVPLGRAQAHYLFGVMRLSVGGAVQLFNGREGAWVAEVIEAGKRGGVLTCADPIADQVMPPDLWLMFAPIKKARTDFIVEKAVEMGVRRIVPVQTDYTNPGRIQRARLQAHAVEAAEQCGSTFVPEVAEMARLDRLLEGWDRNRKIMFCDEALADRRDAGTPLSAFQRGQAWAIVIGPEGGFSPAERAKLAAVGHPVKLGPRILRADTAAVAALTVWQQALGDWP